MKSIHKVFLVALGLILAGCTSIDGVPSVGTFPPGTLNKVKSVTHWKLIAQDVARQAALTLGRGGHTDTPLFLKMSDQPSLFERNFVPLLRSELMAQGLKVRQAPEGSAQLQVQIDRVSHAPVYRTGTLAILGVGLLALRDATLHNSYHLTNEGALAGFIATDQSMKTKYSAPPELELVLSVEVEQSGQYLVSQTQIYYLDSDDRALYEKPITPPEKNPKGKVFEVQGSPR